MLTPKEILTVAAAFTAMTQSERQALGLFIADATHDAVEQALTLDCAADKREALCGYAQAMRDLSQSMGDLESGKFRDWPAVAQYLKERGTEEEEEGD